MLRKFVSATVSAALLFASAAPAMAQEYRFTGFDSPRGVSATVNLRVPLDQNRERTRRASYGVNAAWGRTMPLATMDNATTTRAVNLAEIRFSGDELRRAQLLGFDVRDPTAAQRRMNLTGDGNTLWIVVGLVAAGVAVCLLADCFEDDDESSN